MEIMKLYFLRKYKSYIIWNLYCSLFIDKTEFHIFLSISLEKLLGITSFPIFYITKFLANPSAL